ncbi:ribosomal protein L1/ribosomal biogenesis protein [Absidia repens]|uniref:Ribosomal protein L1/ribosomal biogenesis protein n=1 Tax=Absidia repens TaxID=90262 RepID=A0A1X2HXP1_9FUNG|nr:ribosomal protein L1/ribosomal biogenesis protein [Absidia repens]
MIDIDRTKALHSVKTLYSHTKNAASDDQVVWLTISTFNLIITPREKIAMIPLKHPIQTPGTRRCLFTRDSQQACKDLLVSQKVKGIHKVISVSKYKKQHGSKEGQQQLLDQYDVFLADRRLTNVMRQTIGNDFYKRITPLVINLKDTDLQKQVIHTIHTTYMNFRKGDYHAIKIAITGQTVKQAYENIINAIDSIVANVPGGVDNVRSLSIKTSDSISLPIYEYLAK